jgi:hypothetical protein
MTPEVQPPGLDGTNEGEQQPDLADLLQVLGRIQQSLHKHLPSWNTRRFNPPVKPFSDLRNDLFRLLGYLKDPALTSLKAQADEVVLDLLDDEEFQPLVDHAYMILNAYVDLRELLPAEGLPLWQRIKQSAEALTDVYPYLAALQRFLDE